MERFNLPVTNVPPVGSSNQLITNAASAPRIDGGIASLGSPFRRFGAPLGGHTTQKSMSREDDARSERLSCLSLDVFCERIALLAELELPCAVHIANASAEQVSRGVVRRIEQDTDRLNLFGDGFSLHLHRNNIDAIWLVNSTGGDDQGMAIEIHNRTGNLVARLFGIEDSVGSAVWQDVMGNPSFAVV